MKKALSLIIAVILMLSLTAVAGCAGQTEAPAKTETPAATEAPATAPSETPANAPEAEIDLSETKPGEYIQEKLDAGMEVQVAYLASADNQMNMQIIGGAVQTKLQDIGCAVTLSNASNDVATFISMVENYITMGVSCMVLLPFDAETTKNVICQAQDAGIVCVVYGIEGAGSYTIGIRNDTVQDGTAVGKMARAWAAQNYPGESGIKAAVIGTYAIKDLINRTNAMKSTLDEDPNIDVVFFLDGVQNGLEPGFNAAQDALTYDADIRLFACYNFTVATGVNNYITAVPDADISKFGVFCVNFDTTTQDLLAAAGRNECAIRGTMAPTASTGDLLADITIRAMRGECRAPYEELAKMNAWVEPNFDFEFSIG